MPSSIIVVGMKYARPGLLALLALPALLALLALLVLLALPVQRLFITLIKFTLSL